MILYFTGTGNSLAVAKIIADATGESLFDMGAAYRAGNFEVTVKQGGAIGFVFPTYRWSTPVLVDEFVRRARFVASDGEAFKPSYCFTVETYGAIPGTESKFFAQLLQKYQGISVDSAYSVNCVENCLYLFNSPTDEVAAEKVAASNATARKIAERIEARETGAEATVKPLGALLAKFTGREGKSCSVKHFHVLADACIGCGTCAKVCPTNSITMVDGLPVWSGTECTECLACLHRCSQDASQYGKSTIGRRRYLNPVLK